MFRPPTKYSEYLQDVRKSIDYILKRVNATTVTQIVAGTNVTISPASGTGVVTINASGGGGGGLPAGGTTGQILAKINNVDYNAEWIDNYALWTSTVKHEVKAGEAINKGQAVYVSSADGTNMIVSKASNALEATSSKTLGILAQSLAHNAKGFVITEGLLAGIDTSAAGAAGDPVWLGTDGNLLFGLANKPYAPANMVSIGVVTRKNSSNGEIFVRIQNGFELDELHNVDARNPNNNDGIFYNSTTQLWEHKPVSAVYATPTLAQVTTAGNTTTNAIEFSALNTRVSFLNPELGTRLNGIHWANGTNTVSYAYLALSGSSGEFKIFSNASYFPTFYSNGSEAMRIPTTRNVLIGTTTDAGYKLDVNGTIRSSGTNGLVLYDGTYGAKVSMSTYFFVIEKEGSYGVSTYQFKYSDNSNALYLSGLTSIVGIGGGDDAVMMSRNVYARHDAAFGFTTYGSTTKYKAIQAIYTDNNTSGVAFNYKTGGTDTEAMRITSAGQVGIGTTTPTYKLQVIGSTYNTFSTTAPFLVDTSANNYRIGNLINNSGYHSGGFANNTFDIFSVGANSSTSSNGSQFFRINIHGGSSSGAYGASGNNVTLAQLNAVTNSILYITAQGQGGYIQGGVSGGLTVSTLSDGENLSLRSDKGSGFGGGGINYYASINGANHSHRWFTTLTEHMRLTSGGNLLIGTTTDAGYKLDVNGSARLGNTYINGTAQIGAIVALNSSQAITIATAGGAGSYMYFDKSVASGGTANIGIGGFGMTIALTAILDIQSTTKGFLQPRMTNAQALAITTPATGLQVYDTTNNKNLLYNGTAWQNIAIETWLTSGSNIYYNTGNVGIGTSSPTDKFHIVDNTNGNKFGRISAGGTDASAAWVAQNDQVDNVVYRVFGSAVTGSQMGQALARSASLIANLGGTGKFLIGSYSGTDLIFGTSDQARMRLVDATGNFLIGTMTDNGNKLTVSGNIDAQGYKVNNVLGYTGILNIPTNPPGQQNIDIQGGIVINIF